MAKPELGTKRACPSCGAKYYDLMRDPIVCPKCGTVFEVEKRETAVVERKQEPAAEAEDTSEATAVVAGAEVVSLADVAKEESQGDSDNDDGDDDKSDDEAEDIPDLPDVEIDDDSDDEDAFLDDDEEDDGDVSDILGVPGDEEDT